ncbi:hypothetical protein SO694_00153024 [Aureococcus anophagefferens]|uniref:Uncharacterized protein n=1 Tax=Aureococcus anophagefferens TaxID=44056 RepID=A0ABR1G012_AURAN
MRLLREGCADDASGRLLRNSRALPRLFAHVDCVGTGGWDEELGRLAFHGNVPPGCASLLDEPKRTLRRVKRDVRDCLEDAHALLGAALATRAARRACFHEVGATPWLGTHVFMEPTGEGKNWAKVARYAGWLAAIFAEAARDDDVLERAPLFFTDLSSQTRKVLDCVTDADDARVLPEGYERAPRRRTADLAPLAYASGQLTRRETRTEADARRREADDVFSDEDVDYPDLDLGEVVAGIRKQLEVEKRHRERDAEDRDAPESSDDDEAAPAAADDARCAAFAATDALLLLHYRLSNRLKPPPPADETDLAPANLDFGYVVKDCYFYVFGMDGAPAKRASTPLDAEILALVVANRCELGELHLGAFYGDDGDDGGDWADTPELAELRRKLAELDADDSAAAERAEGRRRDLADCAHVLDFVVDTLVSRRGRAVHQRRGASRRSSSPRAARTSEAHRRAWLASVAFAKVLALRGRRGVGLGLFGGTAAPPRRRALSSAATPPARGRAPRARSTRLADPLSATTTACPAGSSRPHGRRLDAPRPASERTSAASGASSRPRPRTGAGPPEAPASLLVS